MFFFTNFLLIFFKALVLTNFVWYNNDMKEIIDFLNNPDYDILTETLFGLPSNKSLIKNEFKDVISGVYHCSNERLNSYFKDLNLKGSRVATVGSSGDQVLNAIFYGAKDITLIDGNVFSQAYYEYKVAMIKNLDFETFTQHIGRFSMFNWKTYSKISHDLSPKVQQFFDELMLNQDNSGKDFDEGYLTDSLIRNNLFHTPCIDRDTTEENLFYNNASDYEKLKTLLIKKDFRINFIVADIEAFPYELTGKFDYIFLSNIYDYIDKKFMTQIIEQLYEKLNEGGEIQYHYSFATMVNPGNLINKNAYKKDLTTLFPTEDTTHRVYFIAKPIQKTNNLDL